MMRLTDFSITLKTSSWVAASALVIAALIPAAQAQFPVGSAGQFALPPRPPSILTAAGSNQQKPSEGQPSKILLVDPGPVGVEMTTGNAPQIAWGIPFETVVTIINTGDTVATGRLELIEAGGNPGEATFTEAGGNPAFAAPDEKISVTGSSFFFEPPIPPGGTRIVRITGVDPGDSVKTGWATVISDGGKLDGVAIFEERIPGVAQGSTLKSSAGVLFSQPVAAATIPVDNSEAEQRFVGVAVANQTSANLTFRLLTVATGGGQPVDNLGPNELDQASNGRLSLGPGQQVAIFLHEILPQRITFQGSMVLIAQNGGTFLVTALIQNQGLLTAIPVIAGKAPGLPN